MQETLIGSHAMRPVTDTNLLNDSGPDATATQNVCLLLDRYKLTAQISHRVDQLMTRRGFFALPATIADTTVLGAPLSTKNRALTRDQEMPSVKTRSTCDLGMTERIDVAHDSCLVHTPATKTVEDLDQSVLPQLLCGTKRGVLGDRRCGSRDERVLTRRASITLHIANCGRVDRDLPVEQMLRSKVTAPPARDFEVSDRRREAAIGRARWRVIKGWPRTWRSDIPSSPSQTRIRFAVT